MSSINRFFYITKINKLIRFFKNYYYSRQVFIINNKKYKYFCHPYNKTWRNERAVEVPFIWDLIKESQDKRILEVGNVLSHYFSIKHDVVDKYEKDINVINEDIVNFRTEKKYDLIISISTLEHVGWDEKPHNPLKILTVIKNLKNLLTSKGKIIVTLPVGYNLIMDKLINNGKIKFTKKYCLKRVSKNNKWIKVNYNEVFKIKYGSPFPYANGLIFGFLEKT